MKRTHSIPAPAHLQGVEMMEKKHQNRLFHQTDSLSSLLFKVKHKEPRIPIIIRITCVTNVNYTLLKIYFLESV